MSVQWSSHALETDAGVGFEVGAQRRGRLARQSLADLAAGILEVAEQDGLMAFLLAGVGTGGAAIAAIHLVDAQRAGFDRTLATRRMRLLAGGDFVHERSRLVRAG